MIIFFDQQFDTHTQFTYTETKMNSLIAQLTNKHTQEINEFMNNHTKKLHEILKRQAQEKTALLNTTDSQPETAAPRGPIIYKRRPFYSDIYKKNVIFAADAETDLQKAKTERSFDAVS